MDPISFPLICSLFFSVSEAVDSARCGPYVQINLDLYATHVDQAWFIMIEGLIADFVSELKLLLSSSSVANSVKISLLLQIHAILLMLL